MSSRQSAETKTKKVVDVRNIPARRLYRGVLEYARRLENGRQHRRNLMSVFQSEQTGLRHKLRDACEKLMFTHPLEYGKKAEELIWRKVYYEVIQLVKSNKKFLKPGTRLELLYKEYLSAAIGYYHHLLLKLQSKYQPSVDVDWPFTSNPLSEKASRRPKITLQTENPNKETSSKEKEKSDNNKSKKKSILAEKTENKDTDQKEKLTIEQWSQNTCYRLLLCLGDLGRYLVEHGGSRPFSERFYQLALLVKPNIGMPFNQLGTLAGHHTWWGLTAAYYYYRCLEAENKFDGAEGNLQKLLDRNKKSFYQIPTDALENMISAEEYKKEHTRIFIVSYLYMCDLLRPKTYATDVEITGLCKKLIDALPVCLSNSTLPKDESAATTHTTTTRETENSRHSKWNSYANSHHNHHHYHHSSGDYTAMQPHVFLKMCVLCITNIHSLQSSRSNRSSAAIAFALAFFSHLLGHAISKLDPEKIKADSGNGSGNVATNGLVGTEKGEVDENGDGDASHAQSKDLSQSKKKKRSRMMRRRRHRGSGDSDLSEGELYSGSDVSDSDNESDSSESSAATSTNSELSQEGMEDPLEKPDSSPKHGESPENKAEVQESPRSETIVDNHAGLELANSLANGPSTLASLKDISQKMFQPTVKRRILLAPSFFNNIPKPKTQQLASASPKKESPKLQPSKTNEKRKDQTNGSDELEKGDAGCGKMAPATDNSKEMSPDSTKRQTLNASSHGQNGGFVDNTGGARSSTRVFEQVGVFHQLFASLKLFCDWLDANEKVTAACAQNSKALWSRIAKLASLIPNEEELLCMTDVSSDEMLRSQLSIAKSSYSSSKKWQQITKLPEDYILSQKTSSVRYKNEKDKKLQSLVCDLTETQQSVIRICRIRSLCHSLVRVEGLEMNYDEATKKFKGPEEPEDDDAEHLDIETMEEMRKTRLMKDMAELRLRNEVDTLETQLGTPRTRDASLCLYLVPDALALCHDLIHIRRLLSSEKFFIVIPKTVIDGLDGLKKDLQGARDAIRFLDTEFRKGNRYIKAQMAEESSRGVIGERPKLRRNDMQAWRFYRVIECCRYIMQEKAKEEKSGKSSDTSGLVAILTRSTDKSTLSQNQINAISAAESLGVQVFSTAQFGELWKKPPSSER